MTWEEHVSDVVETVTFEAVTETWLILRDQNRDFNKKQETETRDFKFETEARVFKICVGLFYQNFKNVVITSKFIFFKFLAFFRHVFVVSYLQIHKQKLFKYTNFTKPFLCDIQSLETCSLRD